MSFSNELVVGGVGKPRFLLMDTERSLNMTFEFDDSGVYTSDASITRQLVSDNPLSDYCLHVQATSDYGAIYIPFDEGKVAGTLNGKKCFASVIIKADVASYEFHVYLTGSKVRTDKVGVVTNIFNAPLTPQQFSLIDTTGVTGDTALYLCIMLPGTGTSFLLYFNSISYVDGDITLDEEQKYELTFNKLVNARSEFQDGQIFESIKGWRPELTLTWELLTAVQEVYRSQISEYPLVVVFPKLDAQFHIFGVWDGNYKRSYVGGKLVGHEGTISFVSNFIYETKPVEIIEDP